MWPVLCLSAATEGGVLSFAHRRKDRMVLNPLGSRKVVLLRGLLSTWSVATALPQNAAFLATGTTNPPQISDTKSAEVYLKNDILKKYDRCATNGLRDKNHFVKDWGGVAGHYGGRRIPCRDIDKGGTRLSCLSHLTRESRKEKSMYRSERYATDDKKTHCPGQS